jgi:NAD(P)H-dependent FMN reductase
MKYIIVSGSNRKDSQSLKVSKYIKEKIEKEGDSSEILKFEKQPLEM